MLPLEELGGWAHAHAAAQRVAELARPHPDWIPAPENVFRAFRCVGSPGAVRVVILGQDPYPRRQSAVGLSFLDGGVTSFQSPQLAPSMKNVLKAIAISRGLCGPEASVDGVRAALRDRLRLTPLQWFTALSENCGVMWLNASLTFEGKEPAQLQKHLAMWRPVLCGAIRDIVEARGGAGGGVVFVLWGDKAQRLQDVIRSPAGPLSRPQDVRAVRIVRARHPVVDGFFRTRAFCDIAGALASLGLPAIDWLRGECLDGDGGGEEK